MLRIFFSITHLYSKIQKKLHKTLCMASSDYIYSSISRVLFQVIFFFVISHLNTMKFNKSVGKFPLLKIVAPLLGNT